MVKSLSGLEQGTVTFKFTAKVKEDAEANKVINNKAYIDYENRHGYSGEKVTIDVPVTPTAGNLVVIKKEILMSTSKVQSSNFVKTMKW